MFLVQNTLVPVRVPDVEQISGQRDPSAAGYHKPESRASPCRHSAQSFQSPPGHPKYRNPNEEDNDNIPTFAIDEVEQLDNYMRDLDNDRKSFDKQLAELCGYSISKPQVPRSSVQRSIEFSPRKWWKEVGNFDNPAAGAPDVPSASSSTLVDPEIGPRKAQCTGTILHQDGDRYFQGDKPRRASACVPVPPVNTRRSSMDLPISATIRQRALGWPDTSSNLPLPVIDSKLA
jgi:hypothetical protein